jgi:dipeptide/tripeptide permease
MEKAKLSWRFPREFWSANVIELFERCAYYAMFIAITLYLTDRVGFTDVETGYIVAFFAAFLYFMPTFMGTISDRIGFRAALTLAFSLLTIGYALLGLYQDKVMALVSLATIMLGGSFVKPVILATAAKCSDEAHRARAFSIFYMMVNIGSFTGKTFAKPLRTSLGLEYINFFAAAAAFVALVLVILLYKSPRIQGTPKSLREIALGLKKVVSNFRFMALILIVAGFWTIQGQLYATMPKYTIRMIGPGASPEWLANINPLVVVSLVVLITHLVRKMKPVSSIAIALFLVPLSSLVVALSPVLEKVTGSSVSIGSLAASPITIMMIFGIAILGLAECFLSPRFFEYASHQAPKNEEGLYMGYSNLTTFFAWLVGFIISGYLLEAFCPDPKTVAPENMATAYAHAHYIWYVFAGIGFGAFFLLLIFRAVTERIDRKKGIPESALKIDVVPLAAED